MENETIIIEMIQKLTNSMDDFKADMNSRMDRMEQRFDRMEQSLDKVEQRLEHVEQRLDKVEVRLEYVEKNLEKVENKINNLGDMFEHTVKIQLESVQKIDETLKYQEHKIVEHDKDLFLMKNKQ